MLRARVDEIQWGESIMPYVGYFENAKAIETLIEETGFNVTANVVGEFEGRAYIMNYSFDRTEELPTTIEGNFTDLEKLQIMSIWEIQNLSQLEWERCR